MNLEAVRIPLVPLVRRLRPLWWILVLAEVALIYWSSSRSWQDDLPDLALDWTNFMHFPLFGSLAVWLHLALDGARPGSRPIWLAPVLAAVYGVLDECHQGLVPGRDFSLFDMVTDAAGAWFFVTLLDRLLSGPPGRPLWRRHLGIALALGLLSSFALPEILPDL